MIRYLIVRNKETIRLCVPICLLSTMIWGLFTGCISQDVYKLDNGDEAQYDVFSDNNSSKSSSTTSLALDSSHPAIVAMRNRAKRISEISWSPKGAIPQIGGGYLSEIAYTGIPYSSVKECDKFIGQEVSFQTFISAVNNPRSVLYTERVNKRPYKGTNCASYYGTVCSMTVNYALGLERPFSSSMYENLAFIERLNNQDFNAVAPGDIVWKKGHVVLITDVYKDSKGNVRGLEILESNSAGTSLLYYSIESFAEKWKDVEWVIYRDTILGRLDDKHDSFLWNDDYLYEINNDVCLSRGNWAAFREGEDIVVNVLSDEYAFAELSLNGVVIETRPYEGTPDIVFSGLGEGKYQLHLSNGNKVSKSVSFEVLKTQVSVNKDNKWLKVYFNSSKATPEYIVFCDDRGVRYFISDITTAELLRGYKIVKCEKSTKNLYVKVFFKGDFGRISNAIIPLD